MILEESDQVAIGLHTYNHQRLRDSAISKAAIALVMDLLALLVAQVKAAGSTSPDPKRW